MLNTNFTIAGIRKFVYFSQSASGRYPANAAISVLVPGACGILRSQLPTVIEKLACETISYLAVKILKKKKRRLLFGGLGQSV